MRARLIFIVMSLAFVLSACSAQEAGIKDQLEDSHHVKKHITIVAVGDSLTEGIGDQNKKGYAGITRDKIEAMDGVQSVTLKNYAIKGSRTEDLLKRLKEKKVQDGLKEADYIFFTIGGNDLMHVVRQNVLNLTFAPFQKEKGPFEERFKTILAQLREHNDKAKIMYVSMYNPFKLSLSELREIDEVVKDWNAVAKKELKKDGNADMVNVADLFEEESDETLLADDDFHPNQKGYSLMANRLFSEVKKEGLPKE
ncbi:SGNH/GDSL hydrolase family protein [Bacillus sp. FJAT-53060]|uniref:SGNH/GDSL hydrolase family protein n=1 Tax=Bacillus TaxID=1386 RepID=UPI001CFC34F6|nr:SGNH/GDSL hydrolase family protein [Bacillus stratosphericus]